MPDETVPPASPPVLVRLAPLLVSLFPSAARRVALSATTVDEVDLFADRVIQAIRQGVA